jgi:hypothetical protein
VPFLASGKSLLRSIYGFSALGALGIFWWLERHFGLGSVKKRKSKKIKKSQDK